MSGELKPCAHCGDTKANVYRIRDGYEVQCSMRDCSATITAYDPNSHQKAVDRWNTRTTPSQGLDAATVERCEALRQAILNVLPSGNDRLPGDKVISFYIRMDELRAIRARAAQHDYEVG